STSSKSKRKHTGSMKQLGKVKRQKSCPVVDGELETPSTTGRGKFISTLHESKTIPIAI
ncbi:hypothetical protein AVDCRST_MAG84-1514, partial [uncultured Microcoleus sp.]